MLSLVLCWMELARAEDSTFVGTTKPEEAEEKEKPETHVTGELGGSLASGNSKFYTINGLVNVTHQYKRDKLSVVAGLNVGGSRLVPASTTTTTAVEETDEYVENVRRFYGDVRYDRFLSDKDSLYALAGALHDKYGGYDLRSHEQIGYSRLLVKNPKTELRTEIGVDLAQEDYFGRPDPNYQDVIAVRVLGGFIRTFGEQVSLSDTLEIYENVIDFEDVRVLNTASVTSTLSGKLSLKLSHSLIFDNVPVEGFEPLDQTTMVTLVAALL
jgi:putative salt-induced outer membrane protein YdiY